MPAAVDVWSSPTTLYTGGLRQLPTALGRRAMVLIADHRLAGQIEMIEAAATAAVTLRISDSTTAGDAIAEVKAALRSTPNPVPVALGGGRVMDVVRLAALGVAEPGLASAIDGATGAAFLATRTVNPTVCIPSTIGTAAEVSPVAVRTDPGGSSMIISPGLRSAAAIIDPQVTGSLSAVELGSGLIEPLARVVVPAVGSQPLRLQDGVARGLTATILALGDEVPGRPPDATWRSAAALASAQTHLSLIAVGRPPAGHNLWPLATEIMYATGLSKAAAMAPLLLGWLRCIGSGTLDQRWGTPDRVRDILASDPAAVADRLHGWLRGLGAPTSLPDHVDLGRVASRVSSRWQAAGPFLSGVDGEEVRAVLDAARGRDVGSGDRSGGYDGPRPG